MEVPVYKYDGVSQPGDMSTIEYTMTDGTEHSLEIQSTIAEHIANSLEYCTNVEQVNAVYKS